MMTKKTSNSNYYIYFAALASSLIAFSTASSWAWTSPVLPKLESNNSSINPLPKPISLSESAWIVSIASLALIFGPPLSGICTKFIAKKTILLLSSSIVAVAHLCFIIANDVALILLGRFLVGLGSGCAFSVLPIFTAEISEDKNRGLLGACMGIMSSSGSLFAYAVGPYFSIAWLSFINLLPLVLYGVLFGFFVPQSPYDLIIRDRKEEALKSLIKLRKNSDVEKEFVYIREVIESSVEDHRSIFDIFNNKGVTRAFVYCALLMIFQQCSGILAVIGYTQTIFDIAGSSLDPIYSAILVGITALISTVVSCQLIDRAGRKRLLSLSCSVSFISIFILALYFYFQKLGYNVGFFSWCPVVCLLAFTFAYNLALGFLPWIIVGEVFPSNIKAAAANLISIINFSFAFVVTMCFPYISAALGMAGPFFLFSTFMLISTVFCVWVLPETKGQSFREIQKMLSA